MVEVIFKDVFNRPGLVELAHRIDGETAAPQEPRVWFVPLVYEALTTSHMLLCFVALQWGIRGVLQWRGASGSRALQWGEVYITKILHALKHLLSV